MLKYTQVAQLNITHVKRYKQQEIYENLHQDSEIMLDPVKLIDIYINYLNQITPCGFIPELDFQNNIFLL